jgi:drug/metabolite transporter (DMT)-like permease
VVVVIVAWATSSEAVGWVQIGGIALALLGALLIISRGNPANFAELGSTRGDLYALVAMWDGLVIR